MCILLNFLWQFSNSYFNLVFLNFTENEKNYTISLVLSIWSTSQMYNFYFYFEFPSIFRKDSRKTNKKNVGQCSLSSTNWNTCRFFICSFTRLFYVSAIYHSTDSSTRTASRSGRILYSENGAIFRTWCCPGCFRLHVILHCSVWWKWPLNSSYQPLCVTGLAA